MRGNMRAELNTVPVAVVYATTTNRVPSVFILHTGTIYCHFAYTSLAPLYFFFVISEVDRVQFLGLPSRRSTLPPESDACLRRSKSNF